MRYRLVLGLMILSCLAWSVRAWTEPVSPAAAVQDEMVKVLDSEPEKIFQLADQFQADPYGQHAMAIVSILTRYGVVSKKVTLTLGTMIQPFSEARRQDVDLRLFGAYWTGLLVYAVEHDGKAGDTDAGNMYAVNYLLKTYRVMLKAQPKAHEAYADRLAALKKAGKLAAFIHQAVLEDKKHPMQPTLESPTPEETSPTPSESPSMSPSTENSASPSPSQSPEMSGAGDHPSPTETPSGTPTGQP